jgi:hypothetical protein
VEASADDGVGEALRHAVKLLPHDASVHGMLAKHIQRSALLGDSAAFTHALEAARHAIASNPTAGFGWGVLAELFTEAAAEKVAMQAAPDTDLGIARIVRTFQLFFLPLTGHGPGVHRPKMGRICEVAMENCELSSERLHPHRFHSCSSRHFCKESNPEKQGQSHAAHAALLVIVDMSADLTIS